MQARELLPPPARDAAPHAARMLAAMKQHLHIITGASRGLGHAVATALLQTQPPAAQHLLLISRQAPTLAVPDGATVEHWPADLADSLALADRLQQWLGALPGERYASATLINNAGVVSQLAPLSAVAGSDLVNALRVGLEAPTLLSAAFLRATEHWTVPRKLLLVSSGLGRRAMAGSASYCAAKAGMDHLARALALEEAAKPHGARVVSLAPGVIATDMQAQLRGADPTLFPDRERFVALQANGQLDSPAEAAAKLLRYLAKPGFGEQPVGDVRDA